MHISWRWDQGRLEYFIFDNLRSIASSLVSLDGVDINHASDPLRTVLPAQSGLPFLPNRDDYKVWRNYGRVFGCSLLATKVEKYLYVSDICRRIAQGDISDVDEYLKILIQKFRYPSPVFKDYKSTEPLVYPFIAILKLLISRKRGPDFPFITLEDVFVYLIGNQCSGLENIKFYVELKPVGGPVNKDEERQVREMLLVLSQFSFLKWADKKLYLDDEVFDLESFLNTINLSQSKPMEDRGAEFASITNLQTFQNIKWDSKPFEMPLDLIFTEGKRTRITHLKIERSPLLRRMFFKKYPNIICDMCTLMPRRRYPWTDNILEVHHLLPLSSGMDISKFGTSLNDIVGLCPNCHKSVHSYYKIWLNSSGLPDFSSKEEARTVYQEAKKNISL